MPNRTKNVSVFRSQLSCSQSGTSQPERTTMPNGSPTQIRRSRPRMKRDSVGLLKVKLPKFRKGKNTEEKTSMKWPTEPVADTNVCREEATPPASSGPETGSTGERLNDKEKVKLEVLRTISKLLQENQLIRQRLVELNKTQ